MNILHNIIEQNIIKDAPSEAKIIKDAILKHIKCDVLAILFYGSCLRTGNFKDNVADFYVIVSNYNKMHLLEKFIGHLLPPNVYYIEIPSNNKKLRAKYGVFTLKQFKKMSSINAFQPYLWARLVQQVQLIYAKNEAAKDEIIDYISVASITTLFNTLPLTKASFNLEELWLRTFKFTYKSEVRPENGNNTHNIYNNNKYYLDTIAEKILDVIPYPISKNEEGSYTVYITPKTKLISYIKWSIRIVNGKMLSFLRLIKCLFTFKNALTYGYFKLSKHTPNVKTPKPLKNSLFFTCFYIFLVGVKRRTLKQNR